MIGTALLNFECPLVTPFTPQPRQPLPKEVHTQAVADSTTSIPPSMTSSSVSEDLSCSTPVSRRNEEVESISSDLNASHDDSQVSCSVWGVPIPFFFIETSLSFSFASVPFKVRNETLLLISSYLVENVVALLTIS